MKKVKLLAPFVALLAGAVSLFIMLNFEYRLNDLLLYLLAIIVIFYILGVMIQGRINKFIEKNEELEKQRAEEEGTVIEKENSDSEDGESDDDSTEDEESDDESDAFRMR
ncbi:MAG: hypothetical protein MJ133_08850 [Lachnospiraceae bacterium]|nr:hypothetical protein [Lachnospiraceae bacterium]